jgi:Lon protease (S16) C-terminal proteolytic domain
VSAVSGRKVRRKVSMTGELTLTGRVLPIGGLKEKVLGAIRAGIKEIILPIDNEADIEDIPAEVRDSITFHLAATLDDVIEVALVGGSNGRPARKAGGGKSAGGQKDGPGKRAVGNGKASRSKPASARVATRKKTGAKKASVKRKATSGATIKKARTKKAAAKTATAKKGTTKKAATKKATGRKTRGK